MRYVWVDAADDPVLVAHTEEEYRASWDGKDRETITALTEGAHLYEPHTGLLDGSAQEEAGRQELVRKAGSCAPSVSAGSPRPLTRVLMSGARAWRGLPVQIRADRIGGLLLGFFLGMLLMGPVPVTEAEAHTKYCGHGHKTFWVSTPWGYVEHEELYMSGYGSGPHRHNYRTFYWAQGHRYIFVHSHYGRWCPPHAV